MANVTIDSCDAGIEAHASISGVQNEDGATILNCGWGILSYAALALDSYTISECVEGIQARADLELSNSTLSDHSAYGVDVVDGAVTLDDVEISGCATGVQVSSSGNGASVRLVDSTIRDASYRGIAAYGSADTVRVESSTVEDCYDGVYVATGAVAEIDSSTLRANDSGVSAVVGPHVTVSDCTIDSSATNGVYCVYSSDVAVQGGTVRYGTVGLFCYLSSSPAVSDSLWIRGNSTGIKCDNYSSPDVAKTKITGNTTGVAALSGSSPDLSGGSCGPPCAGNSIHHNSGADVANFDSTVTIAATCVYWGSSSGPDPGSFVGSVAYVPWCSDNPVPTAPGPVEDDDEEDDAPYPVAYSLSYNYPNPFNPATSLSFEVPQPGGVVEITVFNARGQRVRTLVREAMPPGVHRAVWDGLDGRGRAVASGVYFVRMTAPGNFQNTKKLVLVK